jgi:hypothetical protein
MGARVIFPYDVRRGEVNGNGSAETTARDGTGSRGRAGWSAPGVDDRFRDLQLVRAANRLGP